MYKHKKLLSLLKGGSQPLAICLILVALALGAATVGFADSFYREGIPSFGKGNNAIRYPDFSSLVKAVADSVVNISSEADSEEEAAMESLPIPMPRPKPERSFRSLGSGFIVNAQGFIITNNHVVENADKIIVRLRNDKHEYPAEIIGVDEKTDLALIKIDPPHSLIPLYFGDSDNLEVGEWVIAIGNQFQLGHSVTAGIVSAKSRRMPNRVSGPYDEFIQTDASINPGSSGGPLMNVRGQVIGVNTAIFSPGRQQVGGAGFNIGIGFAIPINQVKPIVKQLRDKGKVTRGLLGVIIQRVDVDVAEALGLKEPMGALVADVMKGSPAGEAGFQRRDVIVSYDGHNVEDHDDLPLMVANTPVGKVVEVEVNRGGKTVVLTPKVDELKDELLFRVSEQEKPEPDTLGMVVKEVTEDMAKVYGLDEQYGVGILSVEPGSPAAKAGLNRGDILLEIADVQIKSAEHYIKLTKKIKPKKPVLMLIKRKEGTRFVVMKIEEEKEKSE